MIAMLWTVLGWSLILALLLEGWKILAGIAVVWFAAWLLKGWIDTYYINRDYQHGREQAIIRRADQQHNQIVSGQTKKGTYGIYQPPKGLR
jgi:hypothetical protein